MSADWLSEELPEAWPTHVAANSPVKHPVDTESINKSVSDHIDATVAIQHVNRGVPQWKRRLSPKQSHHGNIEELQSMFRDTSMGDGAIDTTDSSNESSAAPDYAMSRKLKLFGDRDTYTEQRCNNLLTSLQGQPDNTNSTNGESLRSDNPMNTFANRSKGDLAARFLKNGENVLSRIRKASMLDMKEVAARTKDESLDDLERKLANGTIDTTADATNKNGSTLSTLSSSDWAPNEPAAPEPVRSSVADTSQPVRQLVGEFAQEYSRSRDVPAPLTDQFGSMKMPYKHTAPTPAFSSLSTVNSGKMRSATSSTVLHHRPESTASTFVPTVQFASPTKIPDISTLAIPGESSEEIEEHNLETKPSMNQVNNDGSDDIVISTSEPSTEISGRSFDVHNSSVPAAQPAAQTHAAVQVSQRERAVPALSTQRLEQPAHRAESRFSQLSQATSMPPQAFDVTYRDGSMFERPLPSMTVANNTTIGNLSIAQRDTTFSGSMFHLAERLSSRGPPEKLEVVDLSNTEMETVKGLEKMLPNVRDLDLSQNSIQVLEGLPTHAVRLDLSHNLLNRLSTFPMANLTTLNVSHNQFTDLRGLKMLRSLVHLDISHNLLTTLAGIEGLFELETLNISHNQLSGIAISHTSLRVLAAGSNPLKNARLVTPQLEELNLDDAEITSIEAVPSVKRLSIRNNAAALDFKGWDNLETLFYDGNDAARNCTAVAPRILWWQGTNLHGFAAQMLRTAYEVVLAGPGLDLSVFVDVYPCQELSLCNMGLERLPPWLPKRFPLVRSLNVAFNMLDDESMDVIAQFRHLEELSLFHNRIQDVGRTGATLRKLRKLRALDLRANPATKFYLPVLFNDQQAPMAAYEEVLDQTPSDSGPEIDAYKQELGLELQWLDGVVGTGELAASHHSSHSQSSFSGSVSSFTYGTPAKRKPTVTTTEDRFASAKTEPDMTARGISTPPRKDIVRQMASDLISLYDLACRQHPDLYGPLARNYVRNYVRS